MYFSKYCHVGGFALLKVKYTDDGSHFSCLVNLRVFITPIIAVTCLVRHLKNKHLFVLSVVWHFILLQKNWIYKCNIYYYKGDHCWGLCTLQGKAEPQLFQSWKRKQSLAIFHTGWSLLGEAWAVRRKFWLKKRCLFPSNLTVPPVTTSSVVWPWVACSVNEEKLKLFSKAATE